MGPTPRRRRAPPGARAVLLLPWAVLAGQLSCAHAGASPEAAVEVSASGEVVRHAPGVAIERTSSFASPAASAQAENGVVVLEEPADVRPARRVVGAFFEAVVAESLDGLDRILDRAAHTSSPSRTRPESARAAWERRFRSLDYRSLASEVLYRYSELEVHTAGDVASMRSTRALPVLPRGEEVLIRASVIAPGGGRFFGSEITFLLRPGPGGYKIAEIFEDFRLP
jgi:hypothetical protein